MSFAWPWMLLPALAGTVLLVLGYRRLSARQERRRQELAALGLVGPAGARSTHGWSRRLAPTLLLAALALLLFSLARPQATIAEPRREGTVVLAIDVSTSMTATDLRPSRIEAAKAAARRFVQQQPSTIRIGVVAFGDSAVVTQRPTTSRALVLAAVDRLTPQGGTAVGRAILTSLSAITGRPVVASQDPNQDPSLGTLDSAAVGYHGSAAVVLLTDGEDTSGSDPLPAAELASVAGVKVHTVGIGSPAGTVLQVDGFQVATSLDESLLKAVAATTDGTYFPARDEHALSKVYSSIHPGWTVQRAHVEVTAAFAATAAVLLLVAALLSVARTGRVV